MAFRDIRKSRKWLSGEELGLLGLAFLILVVLLGVNIFMARSLPGGEQFFLRWSGARAYLFDGLDPYGAVVAERAQVVAYGRPAFSSEYPYALNDPFYIVMLYAPIALISDFAIARGVWMALSEAALLIMIFLVIRSLEWEPPRWLNLSLFAVGIGMFYSLTAFRSGTPVVMMSLIFVGVILSLRSFSDELAGVLLSLVTYQWEVSSLFFLLLLIFVIANRRWRVLLGFVMSLTILLAVSFLLYPGWYMPFIKAVLSDWYASRDLTFGYMLGALLPNVRIDLGLWVGLIVGVIVIFECIGAVNAHSRRVLWVMCLCVAATPLLGFAIFQSSLVAILPTLLLVILLVWERWTRQRAIFAALILLGVILIPFGINYQLQINYQTSLEYVILILPPVAAIIGLYWMRWWAFRAPRTIFDQIGIRK